MYRVGTREPLTGKLKPSTYIRNQTPQGCTISVPQRASDQKLRLNGRLVLVQTVHYLERQQLSGCGRRNGGEGCHLPRVSTVAVATLMLVRHRHVPLTTVTRWLRWLPLAAIVKGRCDPARPHRDLGKETFRSGYRSSVPRLPPNLPRPRSRATKRERRLASYAPHYFHIASSQSS